MYTKEDILTFVEEENVKFIRLTYFDIYGKQKNIAIMPSQLPLAFSKGIVIDACGVDGFENDVHGDLYLKPDPSTFMELPWRNLDGAVIFMICDIYYPNGQIFTRDTRYILKEAIKKANLQDLFIDVSTKFEFYLFKTNDFGKSSNIPMDNGGFMDVAPLDGGENIRRDVCLTLEQLGLAPQQSFHQEGPGQNEVDFHSAPALKAADDAALFKWVVCTAAQSNGLWADFSPKPIDGQPGNAMQVILKLTDMLGENVPEKQEQFTAGILAHIKEMTMFFNPIEKSYKRLGKRKAPLFISWSTKNRFQLIRIPSDHPNRIELRSPDCMANPYLVIALLIYAGLDGIEKKMHLMDPCDESLDEFAHETCYDSLPKTRKEAISEAVHSEFIKDILDPELVREYSR